MCCPRRLNIFVNITTFVCNTQEKCFFFFGETAPRQHFLSVSFSFFLLLLSSLAFLLTYLRTYLLTYLLSLFRPVNPSQFHNGSFEQNIMQQRSSAAEGRKEGRKEQGKRKKKRSF